MRQWRELVVVHSGQLARAVLAVGYLRECHGLEAQHRHKDGNLQVVVNCTRDWELEHLLTYRSLARAFLAGAGETW